MESGWKPNSSASSSKSWPVGSETSAQTTLCPTPQWSLSSAAGKSCVNFFDLLSRQVVVIMWVKSRAARGAPCRRDFEYTEFPRPRQRNLAPPRFFRMRTVSESLREYARGVAGGLLFSLPLLYTMEVWWAGFTSHPWRLAVYVAATFALLLGYNHFLGLRRDTCFSEVVIDSVEEMGLGLLVALVILWLLGRVT